MATGGGKRDLRRELRELYAPPRTPVLVEVPTLAFLMVDGTGDPNSSTAYGEAVEALYAASYALKFVIKRTGGVDYAVMPLEGLWWAEEGAEFSVERKADWQWTMMIAQPSEVTPELVGDFLVEGDAEEGAPGAGAVAAGAVD